MSDTPIYDQMMMERVTHSVRPAPAPAPAPITTLVDSILEFAARIEKIRVGIVPVYRKKEAS